jgi:Fic family protein
MKHINSKILDLIISISEKIGIVKANFLIHQKDSISKENSIKIIFSNLHLDGSILTEKQVQSLSENKRIIGAEKETIEVLNAIKLYNKILKINYLSEKHFLNSHDDFFQNTTINTGTYKKKDFEFISTQISQVFDSLKNTDECTLIKSCLFHYQIAVLKPFNIGNGRMGRLWQRIILLSEYPIFEFLPFESIIDQSEKEYIKVISKKDVLLFIEFMLNVIEKSLDQLLNYNNRILKDNDRIDYFSTICKTEFSRKDYMNIFKEISTASASRDLKKGVELGIFSVIGIKNKAKYKVTKFNYLKLS